MSEKSQKAKQKHQCYKKLDTSDLPHREFVELDLKKYPHLRSNPEKHPITVQLSPKFYKEY